MPLFSAWRRMYKAYITTTGEKTLRLKATEIKTQGQGASGVSIVKVNEPDYLVGIDKVGEKDE